MSATFCTIITKSYFHYAYALNESILEFGDTPLCVLVVDDDQHKGPASQLGPENIQRFTREQVCTTETAEIISSRYYPQHIDKFRWCMKPVFLKYLLEKQGYNKVIFIDPDCLFFGHYQFLFDSLDTASILLSPHWRCSDPAIDPSNFATNFIDGIYNGGFIGANHKGVPALDWWAKACAFKCEKNPCQGFFDDQRYLDLLPSRFEGVESIRHKGCNVANWNRVDCKRTIGKDNQVLINHSWPIIFIHFTASTIRGILLGQDGMLLPFLEKQNHLLRKHNPDMDDLPALQKRLSNQPTHKSKKNSFSIKTILRAMMET